jgi:hypothetical protein
MGRIKQCIGVFTFIFIALVMPALIMKLLKLSVPKPLLLSAALATFTIPIVIGVLIFYFNAVCIGALITGLRERSHFEVVRAVVMLLIANSIGIYALVVAFKVFWLRLGVSW